MKTFIVLVAIAVGGMESGYAQSFQDAKADKAVEIARETAQKTREELGILRRHTIEFRSDIAKLERQLAWSRFNQASSVVIGVGAVTTSVMALAAIKGMAFVVPNSITFLKGPLQAFSNASPNLIVPVAALVAVTSISNYLYYRGEIRELREELGVLYAQQSAEIARINIALANL